MNTAPECIDMTESLRCGAGRLLYNGDEGSLVLSTDGTFLLSDMLDGMLLCEKIRTLCPAAPKLFTVKSDDAAAALMREFSLHDSMRCTQWVYEKSEPPCPVTADIRPLTQEHAALAASVYHDGDGAYIRNRIEHGALFGVFESDALAGFAGFHDDGSMGMLEILPPFRRRAAGSISDRRGAEGGPHALLPRGRRKRSIAAFAAENGPHLHPPSRDLGQLSKERRQSESVLSPFFKNIANSLAKSNFCVTMQLVPNVPNI